MKIGVLASGSLGGSLLRHLAAHRSIEFALTDKASTEVMEFCEQLEIPCFIGNPRKGKTKAFLEGKSCDILLSINYLFLIESDLIQFPNRYAINIHGSLLPKYRGRTPHVWAIINNEKTTGITAHIIDEDCDTGPILKQHIIAIEPEDTGADLLAKFHKAYPVLLEELLSEIEKGTINPRIQEEELATYYGKRTPEDGEINWDWCRERIINWIRAQAPPYPGAFTFIKGEKIIVNKAQKDDLGYHYQTANGTVLRIFPTVIKTNNGALRLHLHPKDEEKLMINEVLNSSQK